MYNFGLGLGFRVCRFVVTEVAATGTTLNLGNP